MRKKYIEQYFDDVAENIHTIETQYLNAINDINIQEILMGKVTSSLVLLRSCLDYMIHDVHDKVYGLPNTLSNEQRKYYKTKLHFLYGKTENNFKSRLELPFKNLKTTHNDIYSLIESIQPFKCNNNWLYDLCYENNPLKHDEPKEQRREDGKVLVIDGVTLIDGVQNIGSLKIGTLKYNGKISENISILNGELSVEKSEISIEIKIDWVKFVFIGTNLNILSFIQESLDKTMAFKTELYKILDMP